MNLRALITLGTFAIAGCSGGATSTGPDTPFSGGVVPSQSLFAARGACDKPKGVQISKNGGTFTIPPCSGFSATINYPPSSNSKGYRLIVTSSVTNNFGAPPPAGGTAIFYVQTANNTPKRRLPVFDDSGVTDTIISTLLLPSHTYTLTVYNLLLTDQCSNSPCPPWTLNIGSPNPSTHSITFSSPLNGAVFAGGVGDGTPAVWQFVQN